MLGSFKKTKLFYCSNCVVDNFAKEYAIKIWGMKNAKKKKEKKEEGQKG